MAEPSVPRMSFLPVVITVVLASAVVLVARGWVINPTPLRWPATAGAAIVAVAIFWMERRFLGLPWGVAAAFLMTIHPGLREPDADGWSRYFAEAAIVAVLTGITLAWSVAFLPWFAWRFWPCWAFGLGIGVGLAWAGEPSAGWLAAATAAGGLGMAGLVAWRFRRRSPRRGPAMANAIAAAATALAVPLLGYLIFRLIDTPANVDSPFGEPLEPETPQMLHTTLSSGQFNRWFWPRWWLTGPLVLLALWRVTQHGWKKWRRMEPPVEWLLPLFTLLLLPTLIFWPFRQANKIPLTLSALVVLLVVYLVGDLLRTLVLPPLEERRRAERPVGKVHKVHKSRKARGKHGSK